MPTGANIYDVQDLDNGVIDVERMGIGDVVALVLDEGKVRTAFVYDHVDEDVTGRPTGGSVAGGALTDKDGAAVTDTIFLANGGTAYWNGAKANDKLVLKPALPDAANGGVIAAEYSIDGADAVDYDPATGISIPAPEAGKDPVEGQEVTVTLTISEYKKDEDGKATDEKLTADCVITYTIIITSESAVDEENLPEVVFDLDKTLTGTVGAAIDMDTVEGSEPAEDDNLNWTITDAVEFLGVTMKFNTLPEDVTATIASINGDKDGVTTVGTDAMNIYELTGDETKLEVVVEFTKANSLPVTVTYTITVEAQAQYALTYPGGGRTYYAEGDSVTITTAQWNALTNGSWVDVDGTYVGVTGAGLTFEMPGKDLNLTVENTGYQRGTITNTGVANLTTATVEWLADDVAVELVEDSGSYYIWFKESIKAHVTYTDTTGIEGNANEGKLTGAATGAGTTEWTATTVIFDGSDISATATKDATDIDITGTDTGKYTTELDVTWTIPMADPATDITGISVTYTAATA